VKTTRTVLKIGGMNCAGCVNVIQKHLLDTDGVEKCEVNLGAEKAVLEYDSQVTDIERLEQAVKDAGYKVVYEKLTAKIEGLTDVSDVIGLGNKLVTNAGIKQVSVNYGNGQVVFEHSPSLLSLSDIRKILRDSGYEIISEDLGASSEEVEARKTKRLFFIGLTIDIPVILLGHFGANFLGVTFSGSDESVYISFACASAIQLWIGKRFYIGAYKMAKMKSANMDTLIVLGTTTAYVFSVTNTFPAPIWENIHNDASVMVIVFILLRKYLENKIKGKASFTIRKLLELQPKMTTVRKKGSEDEEQVSVELLQPGDVMVVRPGEKIPVDSKVIEGNSAVDKSMVTGESMSVTKKIGDSVIGGTINREGSLVLQATKVGSDTFLSQVVGLVEDAMRKKLPMQQLVDKVAGKFAFVIIGVAVITFLSWFLFGSPGLIMGH